MSRKKAKRQLQRHHLPRQAALLLLGSPPRLASGAVVDLNKADVAQLTTISGIGPKKAADIISYRDSHGGFKDINELKEVHGIGDKTFETLAPQLTVGP